MADNATMRVVATSIDFGEFGPDGRLVKMVGFFGSAPASR